MKPVVIFMTVGAVLWGMGGAFLGAGAFNPQSGLAEGMQVAPEVKAEWNKAMVYVGLFMVIYGMVIGWISGSIIASFSSISQQTYAQPYGTFEPMSAAEFGTAVIISVVGVLAACLIGVYVVPMFGFELPIRPVKQLLMLFGGVAFVINICILQLAGSIVRKGGQSNY